MIPSIVHQITAACMPRPAERPSPRKLRQENILMLMLGRNVTTMELMRHQKKSRRMISDDLAEMIEDQPGLERIARLDIGLDLLDHVFRVHCRHARLLC